MKFVHTNIVARDWKALAEFYVSVFDCRIKPPVREYQGEWLDRATGLTRARLKGAHLVLPGYGDDGPTLEIFTYEEMAWGADATAATRGFSHIAFEVDDVETVLAKALDAGGQMLGQVTRRDVPAGTLVFVYFRDPEGNIVEIQSWDSGEN
ncbi:MAG: VOC family protein [Desulfobacterales bacterium]|nr:VOC family protein [Desulfobacterales bacterium]